MCKIHAAVFGPCGDFGHERDSGYGVFVACEVFGQEAVALFAAADIPGLTFELADDGCNPLEAGVAVIHLHVVVGSDGSDGLGGDDGLDDVLVAQQTAHFAVAHHDVVEQNHYYLVAVDELIFTVLQAHNTTNAVGVGVGGEYYVGSGLLGFGDGHSHGRGHFGVRALDSGEVAGGNVLFGHMDDVGEAVVAQRSGYEFHTGAVDRRVHDFEVVVAFDYFRVERESLYGCEESLVHLLADDMYLGGVAVEFYFLYVLDAAHVVDDVHIVGSDNLSAVGPVGLVAVVFFGIVAGGDVHAALASEMTDGERELGGGAEVFEEVNLDAVGREYVSHDFGELARIVAYVVSDDYRNFGQVFESVFEVVGQTLSGGADGVDVHAVGAGAHDAAEAAGAEFEVFVKGFDEFGLVLGFEHFFHLLPCFGVVAIGEPVFGATCHFFDEVGLLCHLVQYLGG